MKRPFMVWIGFISICCSKVAKEGKSCRAQSIYAWSMCVLFQAEKTKITKRKNGKENNARS